MQAKKEFTKELIKTVNSLMGDGYRAEIHCIEKINTGKLHALIILNVKTVFHLIFTLTGFTKITGMGKPL